MAGEFGSPYRAPCGGWTNPRKWYLGGLFNHSVPAHKLIVHQNNVTKVADYRLPEDPEYNAGGIPPYTRMDTGVDWPVGFSCPGVESSPPYPGCTPDIPGQPKCGPWRVRPGGIAWKDGGGTAGEIPDLVECVEEEGVTTKRDDNCYVVTEALDDLSKCWKLGFKNVQAFKAWHGRLGFLSHDLGGCNTFYPDCAPENFGCDYEHEQANPSQTKYTRISMLGFESYVGASPEPGEPAGEDYSQTTCFREMVVDPLSGVLTQTQCEQSYVGTGRFDIETPDFTNAMALMAWRPNCDGSLYAGPVGSITELLVGYINGNYVGEGYPLNVAVNTVSDNEYHIRVEWFSRDVEYGWYNNIKECHVYLSGEYTADDLKEDVEELLDQWNLADDAVYPWRADEFCGVAPLVTRSEPSGGVNPDRIEACGWIDPHVGLYDGRIMGKPLPAGCGPHFDFNHKTWRACVSDDDDDVPYVVSYGAWSHSPSADVTDWAVPATATQWTENYGNWSDAPGLVAPGFLPPGGWSMHFATRGLYAQKWAEILVPRPSQNFARPCGVDRIRLDETTVRCVTDLTGNTVTVETETTIDTGDICFLSSGETTGYYPVTKTGALTYTLGTAITFSDKPSWFDYRVGGGIIGKLRWSDKPGICGRAAITSATNATPIEITISGDEWLKTGDSVVISDVGGNTAANGTWTITRTGAGTFTLDTSSGNGAYTSGGWCKVSGAADYQWNDDNPKRDFLKVEWQFNFRDWQERARVNAQAEVCDCEDCPTGGAEIRPWQSTHGLSRSVSAINITEACKEFSPCCPQICYSTPNSETFFNGYDLGWSWCSIDERYGGRWQVGVVQHVVDPLWQAGHWPCEDCDGDVLSSSCEPVEDDGAGSIAVDLCADPCFVVPGQFRLYPHRPYIEARQTLPTGAPTLPTGITIGFLSRADTDQETLPAGTVLPQPNGPGYGIADAGATYLPNASTLPWSPYGMPWGIFARQYACVCGEARFNEIYKLNGITCFET